MAGGARPLCPHTGVGDSSGQKEGGWESPEAMSRHKRGQSALFLGPVLPTLAVPGKAGLAERGLFLTS